MNVGIDLKRLADYVLSRRVQLDISRAELAERMGKSSKSVERIELGQSARGETYAALEIGLEWRPGSVRRVLGGQEPLLVEDQADEDPNLYERVLRDETEETLMEIVELPEENRWANIFKRRKKIAAAQDRQGLPMRQTGA